MIKQVFYKKFSQIKKSCLVYNNSLAILYN